MKIDDFGLALLGGFLCHRCRRPVGEVADPRELMLLTSISPVADDDMHVTLCGDCALDFVLWIEPVETRSPEAQAAVDQIRAAHREYQKG